MESTSPTLPAQLFVWRGNTGTASTWDLPGGVFPDHQLFNDAGDTGFHVESPRTGAVKTFIWDHVIVEGGIDVGFHYVSTDHGFEIKIYSM
jgi:hypothetical protein